MTDIDDNDPNLRDGMTLAEAQWRDRLMTEDQSYEARLARSKALIADMNARMEEADANR